MRGLDRMPPRAETGGIFVLNMKDHIRKGVLQESPSGMRSRC